MAIPKLHIEEIRSRKFSIGIGREDNPLTVDLHHAVRHLSAELYTKDVHFLMELIQNAEDNEYPPHVEQPSLEFVVTDRDITGVGAPATLLIFNNEKGFTSDNIESLCSVGRSTKKGKRQGGYIGEKGIGFKSVFLVTQQPYIFSNGYRIRFHEIPPADTKIGYIVPEWVEDQPSIEELIDVYGESQLPNTVIILPLRPEKVDAVKEKLSEIHPEVILFMSKIRRLSVREEYNENRVTTVSVSKEISLGSFKDEQSESFSLHLSAEETDKLDGECSYYMWRQTFPVKPENKVEGREEIDKWVITLAFPRDERMGPGIYAFLPTEMVTGLPFIIQADFLLVSSRESIRWDNRWNQGILDCIPSAFCAAFHFLVKSVASAHPSTRSSIFHKYLPVDAPSYPQLRRVWEAIQTELKTQEIILCEGQNKYCTPVDARTIRPAFRKILERASAEGLEKPRALWSTGQFVVHACMEKSRSMEFLGVDCVTYDWYALCIQDDPEWVENLSEDLYVQLLCFLAKNWEKGGLSSGLRCFPLFKYYNDGHLRNARWMSLSEMSSNNSLKIYISSEGEDIAWLTRWSRDFGETARYKFMPNSTQNAISKLGDEQLSSLMKWLKKYPNIAELSISSFCEQLIQEAKASGDGQFIIRVAQFIYFSAANKKLAWEKMVNLCTELPVVDEFGRIVTSCNTKLVPRSIAKWAKLMQNNPWVAERYVTLSAEYMNPPPSARRLAGSGDSELQSFITDGLGAKDIPYLVPANAALPGFSSRVEEARAVLVLEWIHHLTVVHDVPLLPMEFKRSLMEGRWLNTHRGYQSPTMSFLWNDKWLSAGLQVNDLPFIDDSFYKKPMVRFKNALEEIGVVVDYSQGCDVVAKHLQTHTDTEAITRLYEYLQRFNWKTTDSSSVKIWIPAQSGLGGTWKDAKKCVVHDNNHLFHGRLEILERYYSDTLLPFFSNSLGVSLHPRIEDYCNLWLDWISSNHSVSGKECSLVWGNILTHWSRSPGSVEKQGIKLPAYTNNGHIELTAPNETIIPDDLLLKELFKGSRAKFAWHPRTSDPEIPLDTLFSMYKSLGAQNISEAVQKNEASVSSDIYLHRLQSGKGKGLFGKGLYRILLGYLACPSFKLTAPKRLRIVKALLECPPYEVTKPFEVVYSLTVMTEDGQAESMEATAPSFVRWEKDKKRILIQNLDPNNEKSKFCLAKEFAEAISKGLLSEYPDLVGGLCEMLKIGSILGFDDGVVTEMLLNENLQLFEEDERFLQEIF